MHHGHEGTIEITVGNGESTLPTGALVSRAADGEGGAASSRSGAERRRPARLMLPGAHKRAALAMALEQDPEAPPIRSLSAKRGLPSSWLAQQGGADFGRRPQSGGDGARKLLQRLRSATVIRWRTWKSACQDAIGVMMSNVAMDENRRVYFNEIDKMGRHTPAPSLRRRSCGALPILQRRQKPSRWLSRNLTPSKAMESGVYSMSRQMDAAAEISPSAKPKLSMVSQPS